MIFNFISSLLGHHNSFEDHRDYSLKHPKKAKSGWFLKILVVVAGAYLIFLYLKTQNYLL